jgi:hypothetical protein
MAAQLVVFQTSLTLDRRGIPRPDYGTARKSLLSLLDFLDFPNDLCYLRSEALSVKVASVNRPPDRESHLGSLVAREHQRFPFIFRNSGASSSVPALTTAGENGSCICRIRLRSAAFSALSAAFMVQSLATSACGEAILLRLYSCDLTQISISSAVANTECLGP